MNIQNPCTLTAAILLALIQGYSQEAGAPGQGAPIPAAFQPVTQPLSPEASFFYDQLSPYGQWLWMDPYGWVWSPNNVAAGWRPYTDGHWVYTDCGWTWVSDARDFFSTIRHEPQEWPVNGARRLLTI